MFVQESVVEIEYIESHPEPEGEESLLHDDWVSAVHARNDLYVYTCSKNDLCFRIRLS